MVEFDSMSWAFAPWVAAAGTSILVQDRVSPTTGKNDWVPSQKVLFYKLLRDVKGHRVATHSPDPDLQLRAFADGTRVYTIVNNLSTKPHTVSIDMPAPKSLIARRVGRNQDFTPYYREERLTAPVRVKLAGREAMVLIATYAKIPKAKTVNEIPCYGDRTAVAVNGKATFKVEVPDPKPLVYAELRVGISRPSKAGRLVAISLNGRQLSVQNEDAAERIDNGSEYATCKIIRVKPELVQGGGLIQ